MPWEYFSGSLPYVGSALIPELSLQESLLPSFLAPAVPAQPKTAVRQCSQAFLNAEDFEFSTHMSCKFNTCTVNFILKCAQPI